MAETRKVLNQAYPSSGILTPIYIVPVGKNTIVSSIGICNQSSGLSRFRISIAVANAADSPKQYYYYDEEIRGNRNFSATQGWTLAAGDVVRALGNGQMSFTLFGIETDI